MKFIKLLLLGIIFIFYLPFFHFLFSQNNKHINSEINDLIPIDSLIVKFEEKKAIRIFYSPGLFQNKNLSSSYIELPTNEFLERLQLYYKCSVYILDTKTVVIVKSNSIVSTIKGSGENSLTNIGNIEEFGKSKFAKLSGQVVDGKTGTLLPGVSLYFEELKKGIITDINGTYSIELPVGREFSIKLKYMGYEDATQKIKVLSDGKLDIDLYEKTVKLSEVVISADRSDLNVSRTQMSLLKLDAKSIKELPLSLGEIDIIKSVALLPGIQSSGEFGTGFYVRGGSSDQNLILIEDVPIFNSSHLFGLTSIVNPDGIASVTLLKAGIPAKYGERISSVMDIRMGNNSSDETKVKGGIGLINSRINISLPLAKKRINLYIGGRATYSDWLLRKMPDAELKTSSAKFYDFNALISINPNHRNKINLFGYYSGDFMGLGRHTNYNYGNILASFRWYHTFNKNLSATLISGLSNYQYQISESDSLLKTESYVSVSSIKYKNLKYQLNWLWSNNQVIDAGFNLIHYNINPGNLEPFNNESLIKPVNMQNEQAYEYAGYLGDNVSFSKRLSVDAGIRISGYNFTGPGKVYIYNELVPKSPESIIDTLYFNNSESIQKYTGIEPRFSMRYLLNDKSSVKISYTKNMQYINLISNTTVANPTDIWKLSNKYLKPLESEQYALGFFRNFNNNTFETSIEMYYKDLNNCIEYKNGASIFLNPTIESDLVSAKGYTMGIEFFIKKSTGRMTGWLSYSYSKSERRTTIEIKSEQINNNHYFPFSFDKPHNLNIIGNYYISKRWRFSWAFTYNTERPVTLPELKYNYEGKKLIYYSERNKYRLPDYHRLDISITHDESLKIKKKWKGSWTFSVINLYGRKNPYSVFYQKDMKQENINKIYSMYKLYIIGRPLPTITYNFSF